MGETAGGGGRRCKSSGSDMKPAVSHSKILAQKTCSEERLDRD